MQIITSPLIREMRRQLPFARLLSNGKMQLLTQAQIISKVTLSSLLFSSMNVNLLAKKIEYPQLVKHGSPAKKMLKERKKISHTLNHKMRQ